MSLHYHTSFISKCTCLSHQILEIWKHMHCRANYRYDRCRAHPGRHKIQEAANVFQNHPSICKDHDLCNLAKIIWHLAVESMARFSSVIFSVLQKFEPGLEIHLKTKIRVVVECSLLCVSVMMSMGPRSWTRPSRRTFLSSPLNHPFQW